MVNLFFSFSLCHFCNYRNITFGPLFKPITLTSAHLIRFGHCVDKEIDDTSARDTTPLAAVYANGKAHVYYVDTSNSIRAVDRIDGKWSPSRPVNSPGQVDKISQITVVPSAIGNHIFFVPAGQTNKFRFSHAIDKL